MKHNPEHHYCKTVVFFKDKNGVANVFLSNSNHSKNFTEQHKREVIEQQIKMIKRWGAAAQSAKIYINESDTRNANPLHCFYEGKEITTAVLS